MIPSDDQLLSAADRALALAGGGGDAQATAWWERRAGHGDRLGIDVVLVRDGEARDGEADGLDDAALHSAVEAAQTGTAPDRSPGLPDPDGPARGHDGFDGGALSWEPGVGDVGVAVDVRASKVAIVSSRGVRAVERRSVARAAVIARRDGRHVRLAAATVGPRALDLATLRAEADDLLGADAPVTAPAGEPTVVLGPAAVAEVLDALRPRFAVGGERLPAGRRVAASCIALAESPRFVGTLPRSLDAEGLARRPVPLLQDGVAHHLVSDSASGSGTGHATRPGRPAPRAEHLVLVGGGATDVAELVAPIGDGLLVPSLDRGADGVLRLGGAFAIEGGRRGAPVRDAAVELSPLDVLAAAQALTMRQRVVAVGGPAARTTGATVAPWLRATAGLRVVA